MRKLALITLFCASTATQAADWTALPTTTPEPVDNPTTAAKVKLGQMLYFDPRFSKTGTISCNSCHNVMLGGEDNRPVSFGVHAKTGAAVRRPYGIQHSVRYNFGMGEPPVSKNRPKVRSLIRSRWA